MLFHPSNRPRPMWRVFFKQTLLDSKSPLIHAGKNGDGWREEVQNMLSWSEGYEVAITEEMTRLAFIDAVEELDDL